MNWITKKPIAHRGLHKNSEIPENSLASFKEAISKNYAIELDIRITKDKNIVVFHDKNLFRLCSNKKNISNENYSILSKFNLYETKENIPLLSDVLSLVNGQVPLLIEIKNDGIVGEFEELLAKELDNYSGDFAVCSFNHKVIVWFKNNRAKFLRAIIFGDIKELKIRFYKLVFLYRLYITKANFVSLDYELLDTIIPFFCKLLRKPLVVWTINSQKKFLKAKLKADNIIFENIKV